MSAGGDRWREATLETFIECLKLKMAGEKVKLSFGFAKKVDQKQLKDSKLRDESTKDVEDDPDFVLSVSNNNIESSAPKSKKKELIIPLIVKNNWRLPSTVAGSNVKQENEVASDLESQAVNAILEEARRERDGDASDEDGIDSEKVIPILMQNRIPVGYETDERMDVTLRADESTMDDYDRIPIEEYGFAMLKGMGWKEGEGIGLKNKQVVLPIEVNLRPKGLGLGADASAKQGLVTKKEAEEAVNLVVGGYIKILSGVHKDSYGQVEGLDMDNARVVARLAISSSVVTVSEHAVRAVGKPEFKKEGKLLNKAKYDEYKAKSDAALEKKRSEMKRTESSMIESSSDSHKRSKHKHSKEKHRSHHDRERERTKEKTTWVRPQLRVRFIEKSYKDGRFFNTKVIIEDVVNKSICICRTDDGRILEDIPEKWLETVIPRSEPPIIMIVRGELRGQVGEILDKNKSKCIATIQLLQEKQVIQLDYDSICEYVDRWFALMIQP